MVGWVDGWVVCVMVVGMRGVCGWVWVGGGVGGASVAHVVLEVAGSPFRAGVLLHDAEVRHASPVIHCSRACGRRHSSFRARLFPPPAAQVGDGGMGGMLPLEDDESMARRLQG